MSGGEEYAFTTSEASALGCERRWFYGYAVGLKPRVENLTLGKGRLWHAMLEAFWLSEPLLRKQAAESVLEERMRALRKRLNAFDPQGGGVGYDEEELDETEEILRSMLDQYEKRWPANRWRVVSVEEVFKVPVRTPSGRKSPITRYSGRRDILVELIGDPIAGEEDELWLVEMKSTGTALEKWWLDNRYRPQVPRYAWSYEEEHGREISGVIYDLALFTVAPTWESLKRTKPRGKSAVFSPGLSRQIPANLTRAVLDEAVDKFLEDGRDAYRDAINAAREELVELEKTAAEKVILKARARIDELEVKLEELKPFADFKKDGEEVDGDDFLEATRSRLEKVGNPFVEEFRYRFLPGEVSDTGLELYYTGTRIRRLHGETDIDPTIVKRALDEGGRERFGQVVSEIANEFGHRYTRNGHECRKWGRACPFLDLCQFGKPESAATLEPKGVAHVELEDEEEEPVAPSMKASDLY